VFQADAANFGFDPLQTESAKKGVGSSQMASKREGTLFDIATHRTCIVTSCLVQASHTLRTEDQGGQLFNLLILLYLIHQHLPTSTYNHLQPMANQGSGSTKGSPTYLFGKEVTPTKHAISPQHTNQKTSPLSSWFITGGAPNFGATTAPATTNTTSIATNASNATNYATTTTINPSKDKVLQALNTEIEAQDNFSQMLMKELNEGSLDSIKDSSIISIPGSPSSI